MGGGGGARAAPRLSRPGRGPRRSSPASLLTVTTNVNPAGRLRRGPGPDGRGALCHGPPDGDSGARATARGLRRDRLRARGVPARVDDRRAEAAHAGDHRPHRGPSARRLLRRAGVFRRQRHRRPQRRDPHSYERFVETLLSTKIATREAGGELRIKAARFPARKPSPVVGVVPLDQEIPALIALGEGAAHGPLIYAARRRLADSVTRRRSVRGRRRSADWSPTHPLRTSTTAPATEAVGPVVGDSTTG